MVVREMQSQRTGRQSESVGVGSAQQIPAVSGILYNRLELQRAYRRIYQDAVCYLARTLPAACPTLGRLPLFRSVSGGAPSWLLNLDFSHE